MEKMRESKRGSFAGNQKNKVGSLSRLSVRQLLHFPSVIAMGLRCFGNIVSFPIMAIFRIFNVIYQLFCRFSNARLIKVKEAKTTTLLLVKILLRILQNCRITHSPLNSLLKISLSGGSLVQGFAMRLRAVVWQLTPHL